MTARAPKRSRAARACPTCRGRGSVPAPHSRSAAAIDCAACLGTGTYTHPRILTRVAGLEREVQELQLDDEPDAPPTADALRDAIETFLAPMRCTTPGRPAPGIEHCAACCAQTGWDVTCQDELDLCEALAAAQHALRRLTDPATPLKEIAR